MILKLSALHPFNELELRLVLCGADSVDLQDMKAHTAYKGGYTEHDNTVQNFWNLLEKMSQPQLCVLLQFCTGSRYRYIRIPPAVCAFLQYM